MPDRSSSLLTGLLVWSIPGLALRKNRTLTLSNSLGLECAVKIVGQPRHHDSAFDAQGLFHDFRERKATGGDARGRETDIRNPSSHESNICGAGVSIPPG